MYGIVNQGIRSMISKNFGEETWQEVHKLSGANDVFEVSTSYDDIETVKLAQGVCEVLEMELSSVLNAFGKWWIKEYSAMITATEYSFVEFISSLNSHHKKVAYMMPGLDAPMLEVINQENNSFDLKYKSSREGFQPFVIGLIEGLAEHFDLKAKVSQPVSTSEGLECDLFHVQYKLVIN